jgi:hypothetical protein
VLSTDFAITVAFAIVAAVALYQAREWPFRAALFPLATATILLLVALLKIVLDLVRPGQLPAKVVHTKIEDEEEDAEADLVDVIQTAGWREWGSSLGWMAAFFLGLWLLGALVAVPAFAVVYLRFVSRASLVVTGTYALASWAFVYGLFDRLLHIPLPPGVFGSGG